MAVIEMVVSDGHVRDVAAGFNGDIVVASRNVAMGDGDVGGGAWVDAVGVARVARRIDDDAPCGKAIAITVIHVKIRGVLEGDFVEREVVAVGKHDQARYVLAATR